MITVCFPMPSCNRSARTIAYPGCFNCPPDGPVVTFSVDLEGAARAAVTLDAQNDFDGIGVGLNSQQVGDLMSASILAPQVEF